ncbi:MAG: antitoxin family protein [Nitrospirae bacterium]|uniref:antitoxin family protein n=1 Tax=Candidatus Magnetobacterium casense TaxID=1455061 RepID=UPI000591286B|nr:antitoxin family protein [Candidatus Magnetobacterium casensis]MBF0336468.1 antitoxin family protein [Nitrospirota bacterium]
MITTFEVRVLHGVLEPMEPVDLPEGKKFKVIPLDEIESSQPEEAVDLNSNDIWENDPLFRLAGIIKNGEYDLSENHDKYLYGLVKNNK